MLPKRQPAGQVGRAGCAARAKDRVDRARQPVERVGAQGHAPRPAPRVQVLRQDTAHGLFPAEHAHESRGGGAVRQEPPDDYPPGRLHLGHEEARRRTQALHHRRDPCRQRHPGRHRRAEEPADGTARRRCDAPVCARAGRARSAGSGKSSSIAWLAHRLASLHDEQDAKVFHSVIVVTDRRVLDQ